MINEHIYIAIDLKSFYASVECVERGLDPMTTNLVVADETRTAKTICLAVSPTLKAYGIPGRARLFEVISKINEVNAERKHFAPGKKFTGSSYNDIILKNSPELSVGYIAAAPRMAYYMNYSTRIYNIYLKYFSPEDIHVYSIDEVFIDVSSYLKIYNMSVESLLIKIIKEVLDETGITATAGIGTNLYLCKIAMDIVAKHVPADENGVRIAYLDEKKYRETLWNHRPLTDFWRVGRGYSKKLEENGLYTMGDIARCSIGKDDEYFNEELLYKLFGVNAQLLIDHAWGYEPCTIKDIKEYKPSSNSLCSGQVLSEPYDYEKTKLIVKEMTDLLVLDLVEKNLLTDQIILTINYDKENLLNDRIKNLYKGEIKIDGYGRKIPKHSTGTVNFENYTSSTKIIMEKVCELYENIINKNLFTRKIYITANHLINEKDNVKHEKYEQLTFFDNDKDDLNKKELEKNNLEKEKNLQKAMLSIKKKFGKNAMLKGMNLEEGATTVKRNGQVGGHKA